MHSSSASSDLRGSAPLVREPTAPSNKAYPVVELFGPTIQGEGPDCGATAYFVRFGGCDYRCTWCDSMHAVDPVEVRRRAQPLDAAQIVHRLNALGGSAKLVVLTGGNPALHELGPLVRLLRETGRTVSVETQGTVVRPWLLDVDRLVISPKPPSAGVDHIRGRRAFDRFVDATRSASASVAKVVVFDEADLAFAATIAADHPGLPLYLSAGTSAGLDDEATRADILARWRWLVERVGSTQVLGRARVLPQLHVLLWGTRLGV